MAQILELAISTVTRQGTQIQEGDLLVARKPLGFIGTEEINNYLWLLVDTKFQPEQLVTENPEESRKREHYIVLEDLNRTGLNLDLVKLRDSTLRYQPMLDPNSPANGFRPDVVPINIDHLIKTKKTKGKPN